MENLPSIALCPPGFEETVAKEIKRLVKNTSPQRKKGGVFFNATPEEIFFLNIWARTPTRILIQLARTQIKSSEALRSLASKIRWIDWFNPERTIKVDVNGRGFPKGLSIRYSALLLKDIICDYFVEKVGKRPNVDTKDPDIRIWMNFDNSLATISIDTSGQPLFKRGWRTDSFTAPIKENLAAFLVMNSGWDYKKPIVDPMCGSGTLLIEAISICANLPANFILNSPRSFSCQLFSSVSVFGNVDFKKYFEDAESAWLAAEQKINMLPDFYGGDISETTLIKAKQNAFKALPSALQKKIKWNAGAFSNQKIPLFPVGMILTNPPYGKRMNTDNQIDNQFFAEISSILKNNFVGWNAWILSSHPDLVSKIRLRAKTKMQIKNGDLDCHWYNFEMFSGSKFRR